MSAFISPIPLLKNVRNTTNSKRTTSFYMVAEHNISRSEKIDQLTQRLHQLRQQKAYLEKQKQQNEQKQIQSENVSSSSTLKLGKHSTGARFLSVSAVESEEYFPRILLIPGNVSDISPETFLQTPCPLHTRDPKQGNLFLSKLPDGYDGMFVAVPGTELLQAAENPVGLLIDPKDWSAVEMAVTDGDDILLVVDRVMKEPFNTRGFYVWQDHDKVRVGWSETDVNTENIRRIGKVLYGLMETKEELRWKKSCWEEENEIYT